MMDVLLQCGCAPPKVHVSEEVQWRKDKLCQAGIGEIRRSLSALCSSLSRGQKPGPILDLSLQNSRLSITFFLYKLQHKAD